MRGRFDMHGVRSVIVRSLLINAGLGAIAALLLRVFAPWASTHIFHLDSILASTFITCIAIGAVILWLRSLAIVFSGSLRAFEQYSVATRITGTTKILTIVVALAFTAAGNGVIAILLVTAVFDLVSFFLLLWRTMQMVGPLQPSLATTSAGSRELIHYGSFSWLQACFGTLFSQGDRLLVGAILGPAALAYYGVCVQAAQPIHGLSASACNTIFPHLSARLERESSSTIARTLRRAVRWNSAFVLILAAPLVFLSGPIVNRWMGAHFAQHAAMPLSLLALGFAALALNIPGHYALLALGRVQYLAGLNVVGGLVSLIIAAVLIPHFGITGAAIGRLCYGPMTWVLYAKIAECLREDQRFYPPASELQSSEGVA